MSNDVAVAVAVLAALASMTAIAGFFIARMKDAEQRGRQMERIDKLEAQLNALKEESDKKFDKTDIQFEKVLDKLEKISADLRMLIDTHVQNYHREGQS